MFGGALDTNKSSTKLISSKFIPSRGGRSQRERVRERERERERNVFCISLDET